MKNWSVRSRFAFYASISTAVTAAFFAIGTLINLYLSQLSNLYSDLDYETTELVLALDRYDANELEWVQHEWLAWAIMDGAGVIRRHDPKLEEAFLYELLAIAEGGRGNPIKHGDYYFNVVKGSFGWLFVGHEIRYISDPIKRLIIACLLTIPFVLLLSSVGGWWVSGVALLPVRDLADAIDRVTTTCLEERLKQVASKDEISRLIGAFNNLMDRLDHQIQQSKRFVADASHELRTPLTVLKGELDELIYQGEPDQTQEKQLLDMQESVARLDRLIEKLLLLSRLDAGKLLYPVQKVNFSKLVEDACEDAEIMADTDGVSIGKNIMAGLEVMGDPLLLARMVLNLIDNAIRYNWQGGSVECGLSQNGISAILTIRNTGAGISAEFRNQVFLRFTRGDPARRAGGHGLGLSLVREIAQHHNGEIVLEPDKGDGWTEFNLRLPLV